MSLQLTSVEWSVNEGSRIIALTLSCAAVLCNCHLHAPRCVHLHSNACAQGGSSALNVFVIFVSTYINCHHKEATNPLCENIGLMTDWYWLWRHQGSQLQTLKNRMCLIWLPTVLSGIHKNVYFQGQNNSRWSNQNEYSYHENIQSIALRSKAITQHESNKNITCLSTPAVVSTQKLWDL